MNKANYPTKELLFMEAGKFKYQSQEWVNREFTIKAGSMSAFGMAMVGVVATIDTACPGFMSWLLLSIGILVLILIVMAFWILFPKPWKSPYEMEEVLQRAKEEEIGTFLVGMGEAYTETVEFNKTRLGTTAKLLKFMSVIFLLSFLILVASFVLALLPAETKACLETVRMG
ncbi:MAG: hypothetical protein OXE56_11210 [Gammaproteobacteria bacterium]|nr:hypothetical protein [Gammaproteobacteria bacterium]